MLPDGAIAGAVTDGLDKAGMFLSDFWYLLAAVVAVLIIGWVISVLKGGA